MKFFRNYFVDKIKYLSNGFLQMIVNTQGVRWIQNVHRGMENVLSL
jgi:hypothetical protein